MKYSNLLISLLLVAAIMVSSCLGQIHFSPDWVPGKRSSMETQPQFNDNPYLNQVDGSSRRTIDTEALLSLLGVHKGRDVQTCADQVNYNVLINVAKIIAVS
ncbi:adipokinetic prohormone type 1-like precursor [Elysia marginata]|uniref:Adipokinetic prohormone type 1-like n=1 Tax=Elysia marginata TaxID=1093978 RepID=A0AAV4GT90_9GAST|nr:adipokinetic prohormone type 1-like precursor [Elysia marginata]